MYYTDDDLNEVAKYSFCMGGIIGLITGVLAVVLWAWLVM